ncbi:hypothetical protein [Staphylococcus hominis]|uniref:hypothetical protein n=1 Tax=Staphylococcus hominis TaxID=1290 RepID=UPI002303F745|nr:hypothetical protein [Staphylococcus hominis]
MVKVKVEKKMNLLELLKWAQENDITKIIFFEQGISSVSIDRFGLIKCVGVDPEQIFTVNDEEEITEETILEEMFMLNSNTKNLSRYTGRSIASVVKGHHAKAFYIKNDDFNMTLIWKDGELVGEE